MTGLKIQVNGTGVIPRNYGLAPRKEPFMATDIHFIHLILNTNGLTVKFINPETNRLEDLTKPNLRKIWDKYANWQPVKDQVDRPQDEMTPAQAAPDVVDTSDPVVVVTETIAADDNSNVEVDNETPVVSTDNDAPVPDTEVDVKPVQNQHQAQGKNSKYNNGKNHK